jgi:DNA-binding transcriptional LysR family regulator
VRHELLRDPVQLVLPEHHPATRHRAVPLEELRDAVWTTGHAAMGWEDMTQRTCRLYGGFEPDIRHRTNGATLSLALVARGLAVTLLPDLVTAPAHPGVVLRPIADTPIERAITAVTRAADATRPSVNAVLAELQARSGQTTASASTTHSSPNDSSAA